MLYPTEHSDFPPFTETSSLLIGSSTSRYPSGNQYEQVREKPRQKIKNFRKPWYLLISGLSIIGLTTITFVHLMRLGDRNNQILKSSNVPLTASNNGSRSEDFVIETPLGKVKGYVLESREGRDYYAFYKVPYAKPPVGTLRFKSPEPPEKWEGVRDYNQEAPQCIQKAKYSPIAEAVGEEDCLYMNIYTPKLPNKSNGPEDALMPTLVYVHGGAFIDGNGSRYGGKYFMDEEAVLITFQYRLGPFGFLSTKDGKITGNMGFKDQVMVLKWVREYVKYFGGDPNRVMIFGNSAGGFSVSHLMISPMANGKRCFKALETIQKNGFKNHFVLNQNVHDLFHSAITESGGSFCDRVIDSDESKLTLQSLAKEVGCSSSNQKSLIQCLTNTDAKNLAIVRTKDVAYNSFGLIIENYETENSSDVFMPESPYDMLDNGRGNRVPWIIGVTSAEAVGSALSYLTDIELIDTLNQNFSATANELIELNIDEMAAASIATEVKDFYFGDNKIGNETERNLTNLASDRRMFHCSEVQARMQAKHSSVYLYYLSKEAGKSYADSDKVGFPPGRYGVAHGDELQFLFNYNSYPEYPVNSSYYPFSRLLIKTWTHFAATGKPYSSNGIDWETVNPDQTPIWFELNENPQPTTVLQSRMEFWNQFNPEDLNYK